MASKRWDVLVTREYEAGGQTRTAWTRVGSMFEGREGFVIHLDALPIGGKLIIREHEDKPRGAAPAASDSDDLPF